MVVGVSFDTVAANAAFVKKYAFPFPILCDTDRAIGVAYGAAADAAAGHARRITVVVGADGRVEQVIEKLDVKTHPTTLLASFGGTSPAT